MQHLIKHTYIFLGYVQDVQVGLGAATLCDKGPGPSSNGKTTHEYSDKQEIVPLIQLNRSRRGLQKSVSATDSNKHSKNPRLEPSAKKHSCKIPIAKPEIVNNSEYSKDTSIQNSQNLFHATLQPLTRVGTLLSDENTETKKADRYAHTCNQGSVRRGNLIILSVVVFLKIYYIDPMLALLCTLGLAFQSSAFPPRKRVILTVTFKSTLQPYNYLLHNLIKIRNILL